MFPQVTAKPRTHHWPIGRNRRTIIWISFAPNGRIMMSHPSATMIHVLCSYTSRNRYFFCHLQKRLVTLRQISQFSGPIIHFSINITSISSIPWWYNPIIPYTLQIERLPLRPRSTNHQITPIMKEQSYQSVI